MNLPLVIDMDMAVSDMIVDMDVLNDEIDIDTDLAVTVNVVSADPYQGPYEVIPKAHIEQTLLTENKFMTDDVTVRQIPYYETSNPYGKTIYIGEDYLNG